MPWEKPWDRGPQTRTETTTPGELGQTLTNMLPMPERPPPQDDPLTQFEGMTSPSPWDPYGSDTGAQVLQRGLPMAGGMLGSVAGPIGAGIGAAGGDALAQGLTGQSFNPMQTAAAGVLGAGGAVAGRVASGVSRIAERGLRNSPLMQSLGMRANYATADAPDPIDLTSLSSTVNGLARKWNNIIPSTVRPVPTQANRLVNELDELQEILQTPTRSLADVSTIRRLIGTFIEGNKTLPEAKALYGALMTDLRAAAPSSPAAAAYLHDLGNDKIVRSLFPENMLERMLLYGSAGIAGMGNPGIALPAAGLLGARAFQATPRSVLDPIGAGGATLANPFARRP